MKTSHPKQNSPSSSPVKEPVNVPTPTYRGTQRGPALDPGPPVGNAKAQPPRVATITAGPQVAEQNKEDFHTPVSVASDRTGQVWPQTKSPVPQGPVAGLSAVPEGGKKPNAGK